MTTQEPRFENSTPEPQADTSTSKSRKQRWIVIACVAFLLFCIFICHMIARGAIHRAAYKGNLRTVKFCIFMGADVNTPCQLTWDELDPRPPTFSELPEYMYEHILEPMVKRTTYV